MKYGSDKEVQAITSNLKEQRMLEKTRSVLKLEKDYALKLIELSNRDMKIHQRWLKTKVGRIKSHLSVDEIKEFRELENEGRFGPTMNTVKVSSAFTIRAATRRLRLKTERKKALYGYPTDGSATTIMRTEYQQEPADPLFKGAPARSGYNTPSMGTPPATPTMTPSARFHFSEVEEHSEAAIHEPSIIEETQHPPKMVKVKKTSKRSRSMPKGLNEGILDGVKPKARPATSVGLLRDKGQTHSRCKSSSGYSSHATMEIDAKEHERAMGGRGRMTQSLSVLSNGSIDSALNKGRLEERRQILLDLEHLQTEQLINRKQEFLKGVNQWIEENQGVQQMSKLMAVLNMTTVSPPPKTDVAIKMEKQQHRMKPNTFYRKFTYRKRQESPAHGHWKDLNKCRYLRLTEDKIDLSGVVTLARDQMQMFKAIRVTDDVDDDDKKVN